MQGVADGHILVIDYYSQKEVVQNPKDYGKTHLADAFFIGYDFSFVLYFHQHLGDGGGGEADVHKGQVGVEEVHGCVQVGV